MKWTRVAGLGIPLVLLLCGGADRAHAQADEAVAYERALYVTLFTGAGWPIGDMNVILDPGFVAGGRGEYALTPLIRMGAQLSFHSFDSEFPYVTDNEGVILMSLFAKALGEWGPYQPFALFGLGAYVSKVAETAGRRWDGGVQVGAGLEYPVSEDFIAAGGFNFHMVLRGGEQNDYLWLEGYLAFSFKMP